ncbi:hypothetical protein [Oricola thermophila]|uniref:Uncharacterized protein n=1 Tax=Oricola thermophila TaxID=2742145 RepID=A0A6N1VHK2_9HYPH|nr:hypothetical protein [Oricola thermophila]QKV20278.1 hypothetical protein HTY61_18370 [Oricola thermophila]
MARDITAREQDVLDHLSSAWNAFLQLPPVHREETDEFRHKLHDLQRMVLARPITFDPEYTQPEP